MTKIGEVFSKSPEPEIQFVIKVTDQNPRLIFKELDEYVVTEEIRNYYCKFLDQFIESRNQEIGKMCVWVSGFFGSGKSHFVKTLGNILENKEITDSNGSIHNSTSFFCKKHSLNYDELLTKEFRNKTYFVYMLDWDREKFPSISQIVYKSVLLQKGYSEIPWIAEIEQNLQKKGLWEKFKETVEAKFGSQWESQRKITQDARSVIAQCLIEIDPKTYPTLDLALQSTYDVEKDDLSRPSRVAQKILDFTNEIDPVKGRIILVLDEVGQYISRSMDRLTELNAISEEIEKISKGKICLICTAQETLADQISNISKEKEKFFYLEDRFQLKFALTPRNINKVVKVRMLEKKSSKKIRQDLDDLYSAYSGNLNQSSTISGVDRDSDLFETIKKEDFIDYYPLLPYHIYLMQEIFGALRSKTGVSEKITGHERAVLKVVQYVLRERTKLPGSPNSSIEPILQQDIGILVTFDLVYNAIAEELKDVDATSKANIEDIISKLGEVDSLSVANVAKTLYLIQEVSYWLPCTAANIAAVLYPQLGTDHSRHLKRVKDCLEKLEQAKWIIIEDNKYRFLRPIERSFEMDVAQQSVSEKEKRELVGQIVNFTFKQGDIKIGKFLYKKIRPLPVKVNVDNEELIAKGDLQVELYTPYRSDDKIEGELLPKSLANENTIYWIAKADNDFNYGLERVKQLEKVINIYSKKDLPKKEQEMLDRPRKDIETLQRDELPNKLILALEKGRILLAGQITELDGQAHFQDLLQEYLSEVAGKIYTEFEDAAEKLEKEEHILKILSWKSGGLPKIYEKLKLFNPTTKEILIQTPLPSKILNYIRGREDKGESVSGKDLISNFDGPPFGWDNGIVRLTIAALIKRGTLFLEIGGKEYINPQDEEVEKSLKGIQTFNHVRLKIGEEIIPTQRDQLSALISKIFGVNGGTTIEEIDNTLLTQIASNIERIKELTTIAQQLKLDLEKDLMSFRDIFSELHEVKSRNTRLKQFLDTSTMEIIEKGQKTFIDFNSFVTSGKLEEYKQIKQFIDLESSNFKEIVTDKPIKKQVEDLINDFKSGDFISRWPNILSLYHQVKVVFCDLYSEYHQMQSKTAEDALKKIDAALKENSKLEKDLKKKERELLEKINSYNCQQAELSVHIAKSPFKCPQCTTNLKNLSERGDLIDNYVQKILSSLQQPAQKPSGQTQSKIIDKYQVVVQFLRDQGMKELVGGGTLHNNIAWDKIEPDYQKVAEVVREHLPNRIIVANNAAKLHSEDLINENNQPRVWIASLENYSLINENPPQEEEIVGWAVDIIPLIETQVKPVLQYLLGGMLVVKTKADRDNIYQKFRIPILTLTGEYISAIGDVEAGKI